MKKILIYGAGQLGVNAMSFILNNKTEGKAEVVMYSPHNHKRVEGAIEDLKDSCAISNYISGWKFFATNNYADFSDSNIAIFCAGASFKPEEYEYAKKIGIDDRMLQASKNMDILKDFCSSIKNYAPNAKIFIVTNPVDMMTEIARKELPNNEIYGLGCYLDSARFKRELYEELIKNGYNTSFRNIKCWILGHHCATMFLNSKTLSFDGIEDISKEKLQYIISQALEKTRNRGLIITNINAASQTKKLNNGAYFAPATMIADVMISYVTEKSLILPANRFINDNDCVGLIGYQAQMLIKIIGDNITAEYVEFAPEDILALEFSINTYEESKKLFFNQIL